MNKWNKIWNSKGLPNDKYLNLQGLITANGFDTGVGSYDEQKWRKLVLDFYKRNSLTEKSNILEIGCGSGAFIYALNEIISSNYYGLDYSSNLIKIARLAVPNGKFKQAEASSNIFNDIEFDIVFSHSVFQYFSSIDYAYDVIEKWVKKIKSGGTFALLDLNDADKEANYHNERMQSYINPEEYYQSYEGLNHLFFNIEDLKHFLRSCNMKNIEIFPHAVQEYGKAKFRLNISCKKM